MNDNILSIWKSSSETKTTAIVLPDGCRDLIMKMVGREKPQWIVSPMFDQAKIITIEANSAIFGYRMKPGVLFAEKELLKSLQHINGNRDDISNLLTDHTNRKHSITEALNCLATDVSSVKHAANELGISTRTLQRLITTYTDKPPTYWILLARARRAARALSQYKSLADLAEIYGYADQSHMNREFRRWFNTTPLAMRTAPSILGQLYNEGYD